MPDTFDLDNQPPDPHGSPGRPVQPGLPKPPSAPTPTDSPLTGQLPTTRASALLKAKGKGAGGDSGPDAPIDRRATKFDDTASGLFTLTALVFLAGLIYLLYGIVSGNFADPNWQTVLHHADRFRIMGNIQVCGQVMWYALLAATLTFLFLYYHEDYAGYTLLGAALFLMILVPYASKAWFNSRSLADTDATTYIYALFASQAWIVGVPGILLVVLNIIKSLIEGLSAAKARRGTFRFGQAAVKDIKPRNKFLGACWDLPYCKEGIRQKCPIYTQKRGPCWRNKRGCMCDQTIILIAQAPNWKQSVASTVGKLDTKRSTLSMPELPPQPQLSREAKNERCRQCVIYNLHQEQKYKFLVGLSLAAVVGAIYYYSNSLLTYTGDLFTWANSMVGHFSLTGNTAPLFPNGAPLFVEWLMLGSVVLVGVAQLLRGVEFLCFKLKI
jgi:hypothetical protein